MRYEWWCSQNKLIKLYSVSSSHLSGWGLVWNSSPLLSALEIISRYYVNTAWHIAHTALLTHMQFLPLLSLWDSKDLAVLWEFTLIKIYIIFHRIFKTSILYHRLLSCQQQFGAVAHWKLTSSPLSLMFRWSDKSHNATLIPSLTLSGVVFLQGSFLNLYLQQSHPVFQSTCTK